MISYSWQTSGNDNLPPFCSLANGNAFFQCLGYRLFNKTHRNPLRMAIMLGSNACFGCTYQDGIRLDRIVKKSYNRITLQRPIQSVPLLYYAGCHLTPQLRQAVPCQGLFCIFQIFVSSVTGSITTMETGLRASFALIFIKKYESYLVGFYLLKSLIRILRNFTPAPCPEIHNLTPC